MNKIDKINILLETPILFWKHIINEYLENYKFF